MWKWIKPWEAPVRRATKTDQPGPGKVTARTRKVAGKYVALYDYLERRYANTVVLSFGQIEDLIGFALPDLARTRREWWTTVDRSTEESSYSDAWILAGWAASPNLLAHNVCFERTSIPSRSQERTPRLPHETRRLIGG